MKKLYHLGVVESEYKLRSRKGDKDITMKTLSDTLWTDLDKATEHARSIIHNEYLNDRSANSRHLCKIESITTESLLDGFVFIVAVNEWNHEQILDTKEISKGIYLIPEKRWSKILVSNLLELLKPGIINGHEMEESH